MIGSYVHYLQSCTTCEPNRPDGSDIIKGQFPRQTVTAVKCPGLNSKWGQLGKGASLIYVINKANTSKTATQEANQSHKRT